jgi:hypothetical protein
MKRFLLLFLTLLCFTPLIKAQTGNGDPTEIILGEGGSHDEGRNHRSPSVIPIEASYFAFSSSLLLTFNNDLGSVIILVENQTSGWYFQTQINAISGSQLLPISGDVGLYEITFTLSDGHEYIGTFEIE